LTPAGPICQRREIVCVHRSVLSLISHWTSCELGRRGREARIGIQSRGGESGQRAAASIDDNQDISRPTTVSDENVRTVASEHRDARWRKSADAAWGPDPGFDERARTQAATEQSP
jgi:hypothetical protein